MEQASIAIDNGSSAEKGELVPCQDRPDTKALANEDVQEIVQWGRIGNILIGDFFHNFFDGVSTAIAFKFCGSGPRLVAVKSCTERSMLQDLAGSSWEPVSSTSFHKS
eukprot:762715-Hanusia_phi.AAC.3